MNVHDEMTKLATYLGLKIVEHYDEDGDPPAEYRAVDANGQVAAYARSEQGMLEGLERVLDEAHAFVAEPGP
jgi:ubiquitin